MSDWVIYPWHVAAIVRMIISLILGIYLLFVPNKGDSTRSMMYWLLVGFFASVTTTLVQVSDSSGWTNPMFESTTFAVVADVLISFEYFLLLKFIYQLGSIRFEKEQKWTLRALGAVFVIALLVSHVFGLFPSGVLVGPVIFVVVVWAFVLLIRKWLLARKTQDASKSIYGALLLLVGFYVSVNVIALILLMVGQVQLVYTFSEVVSAVALVTSYLVLLQFVPELTSLESKFVAVGMLIVVAWVQVDSAPIDSPNELVRVYAPGLQSESVDLIPTVDGGYRAERRSAVFYEPKGDTLGQIDEFTAALKLDFPLEVYGQVRDSVFVTSNGLVSFERWKDRIGWQRLSNLDSPGVAALNLDLNPAQGGRVLGYSTEDSLMVTWSDVPFYEELYELSGTILTDYRLLNAQIVLRGDGSMTISRGKTDFRPLEWSMGISPGLTVLESVGNQPDSSKWTGARGLLVSSKLPVTASSTEMLYLEENNLQQYRAWASERSFELGRKALIVIILVLIGIPLYYRLSIRRRLQSLMVGLGRVNDGDLDQAIPVQIHDEVGQLSTSFNAMTASLKTYNSKMEDLVEERTAALRATQAQLVEQEKLASLGSLTAGIAHEIKNPLNFVNNFAEVGAEMADELREAVVAGRTEEVLAIITELQENATQITKHGRRADEIVKAMMQHARGGASEMETVELNSFLEEYANLAWHGRRAKEGDFQAELVREFADEVGEIKAMPQELGRVVLNLLNNAFDAVRGVEGARVAISTQHTMQGVHISVSDNGPGIPEAIRDKIFEPFFTTKPTGEGTGLGLSLSYDIITKGHGGTLTVSESVGGGARFELTLPL